MFFGTGFVSALVLFHVHRPVGISGPGQAKTHLLPGTSTPPRLYTDRHIFPLSPVANNTGANTLRSSLSHWRIFCQVELASCPSPDVTPDARSRREVPHLSATASMAFPRPASSSEREVSRQRWMASHVELRKEAKPVRLAKSQRSEW